MLNPPLGLAKPMLHKSFFLHEGGEKDAKRIQGGTSVVW